MSVVLKTSRKTKAEKKFETNEKIHNLLCYHTFEGKSKLSTKNYTSNSLKTGVDYLKHLYMDYSHCSGGFEQGVYFSKYLY